MTCGCVLYGTASRSTLAIILNSSAAPRAEPLPLPKASLPGCDFAKAMNSGIVVTGSSLRTITICAPPDRPLIGSKLFTGSYGSFL
jgi:hypothetical protein